MSDPITIIVRGEPVGKGRPRFGRGKVFTPDKTRSYEREVGLLARVELGPRKPLVSPVQLNVRAVFSIPESWSKTRRDSALVGRIRPTVKPDMDNILKAVADALNGIVYLDDKQVTETTCSKRYGVEPMVIISVIPIVGSFSESHHQQEKVNEYETA